MNRGRKGKSPWGRMIDRDIGLQPARAANKIIRPELRDQPTRKGRLAKRVYQE